MVAVTPNGRCRKLLLGCESVQSTIFMCYYWWRILFLGEEREISVLVTIPLQSCALFVGYMPLLHLILFQHQLWWPQDQPIAINMVDCLFQKRLWSKKTKISWIVSDLPLFAQITWRLLLNTAILTSDDFVRQSLSLTEIFTTWFSSSQCVHSSMVCYSPPTWSAFQWRFPDA